MHRNKLREMLAKYDIDPKYLEEAEYKSQILNFLNSNENCFERSLSCGHFTGSCWLVNPENTKFLLTLHKKIGLWLQLGGHADGDSDLAHVAHREAYEESGLDHIDLVSADIFDIGVHLIESYKGVPAHCHYDVRFLLQASDENIKISDESDDLHWFETPPDGNFGDGVVRMYKKWKALGRSL